MHEATLFEPDGFDGPEVSLDGFHGPIDLLLHLTQKGKVDIRAISTSDVAEQFLAFVRTRGQGRLEHVADWLVMAATLVWIKSRLLLPAKDKERRQAEALVETLAHKLRRLEAIRSLVGRMGSGLVLGEDWFAAAASAGGDAPSTRTGTNMRRLLAAYAKEARRIPEPPAAIRMPQRVVGIDEAFRYVLAQLDAALSVTLFDAIPPARHPEDAIYVRSGICATFVAFLELAKQGKARIETDGEGRLLGIRTASS